LHKFEVERWIPNPMALSIESSICPTSLLCPQPQQYKDQRSSKLGGISSHLQKDLIKQFWFRIDKLY